MALGNGASYYAGRIGGSPKLRAWKYDGWQRGQNSFAEDNEIRDNEFYDGVNIELTGRSSVRLPRRGRRLFTQIGGATNFNGFGIYKDPVTNVNVMLVMFDGRLYSVNSGGVATEIDDTKTWDDTATMRGVLLRGYYYFGNGVDYMAKTDGASITEWNNVTAVTFNSAVLAAGATDTEYEYGITAVTDVGETEVSNTISLFGPSTLTATNKITATWNRKTDADVKGYNIYKSSKGSTLTLLTFIDQQASGATMSYVDEGVETRSLIYEVPTFNTTGGVKGNIFAKYANTLFIGGNLQEPDTVFYGGTGSNWESFSPSDNGGWVKPGRGDGDRVTAMIGFEDFLFIFKENSIWKFVFGSDGGPTLSAVIPQYGTSSPDSVQRMEKDVVFFGTDGRYRILGYEPTQLNVIRTSDISNRIQPQLDALEKTDMSVFKAAFFEQKFILCNGDVSYPYDRRYLAFLGKWDNQDFDGFTTWDKSTGKQMLFAAQAGTGKVYQVLVDGTYDDDGTSIESLLRVKRVDGGEDTILKYFTTTTTKLKNPVGRLTFTTFKDGTVLVDETAVSYQSAGGIGEGMFDEFMFDEGTEITSVPDAQQLLEKELYFEAYSIYHQFEVTGNSDNHLIVQTMSGFYEMEDPDNRRDELII